MAEARSIPKARVHYAWVVAGVTFLTLLTAAGVGSARGILILPLEHEYGWSRTTISAAISLAIILYGLLGPFAAALVERFGIRGVMVAALALMAAGSGLTPLMTAPWQFMLLWGVVVGGGTGMTALALSAIITNRWFSERRGLVQGILSASTSTGQLLFLPAMAAAAETYGWRVSMLGIAAVALCAMPIVALLMRNRPADIGLRPYGETGAPVSPPVQSIKPVNPAAMALAGLGEGIKSRNFWLLFGSFFVCGFSTNGLIGTHLISACADHGIPEVQAAGMLAAMGIFDILGTTASGWLSDRYDSRYLLFWYYGLRGLSLIYLPYALDTSFFGLSLFTLFYGLDWIATVPPTIRLASNIFGRGKVGIMFGWIFTGHQIGASIAALGAGAIRLDYGSYLPAFVIAGALCLVAAAAVLAIGRKRHGQGIAAATA